MDTVRETERVDWDGQFRFRFRRVLRTCRNDPKIISTSAVNKRIEVWARHQRVHVIHVLKTEGSLNP